MYFSPLDGRICPAYTPPHSSARRRRRLNRRTLCATLSPALPALLSTTRVAIDRFLSDSLLSFGRRENNTHHDYYNECDDS